MDKLVIQSCRTVKKNCGGWGGEGGGRTASAGHILRSVIAPPTNLVTGRHTVAVLVLCLSVQMWQSQLSVCAAVKEYLTVCLCRCEGVLDCHRHVERGLHHGGTHFECPPAVGQKRDGADPQDLQPSWKPYCSELAQAPGPAESQKGKTPTENKKQQQIKERDREGKEMTTPFGSIS